MKASPEVLYNARKTVIRIWKSKKEMAEIVNATDFSQDTVYINSRLQERRMKALRSKKERQEIGRKTSLDGKAGARDPDTACG